MLHVHGNRGVGILRFEVDLWVSSDDLLVSLMLALRHYHFGGRCIVLRSLDSKMQENTQEIREMGTYQYI